MHSRPVHFATCLLLVLALGAGVHAADASNSTNNAGGGGSTSVSNSTITPSGVQAAGPAVTLDSSIILLYLSDVAGGTSSPCQRMVAAATAAGGRSVNFVVTGYFADVNGDSYMDAMGYRESAADRQLRPLDQGSVQRLKAGLTACMQVAAQRGLSLAVHPHLDDGYGGGTWRNQLRFDPGQSYGGLSYWDGLLLPTAQAAAAASPPGRPLYFALQAEMGATVFFYPRKYQALLPQLRQVLGRSARVGVSLNWEKLCGCPTELMASRTYLADLKPIWNRVRSGIDTNAVRALLRAVDWIGISAYAALPLQLNSTADLEASAAKVDAELRLYGLSLSALLSGSSGGGPKELLLSEFGLGGGRTGDLVTPAATPAQVASTPYWGVDAPYERQRDPWAVPGNSRYRRRFYELATAWLARGGGPRWRVTRVWLWNVISYDVQGIHYTSRSNGGSFRDDYIASLIQAHNNRVRRGAV